MTTPSPPGTILITGANGGLGSALAKTISESADLSKFHAVYTVRNVETATTLKSALANAKPDHKHDIIALDLSSLANVRQVAATLNKRVANGSLPPIRAFIHNAAFQEQTTQSFTGDGFDMSFQCNYLSHWLLTMLLLESMDKESGRIVVVGSSGHDPSDKRNNSMGLWKDPKWRTMFHSTESLAKGTWSSTKEDPSKEAGMRRYCATKLCQTMMVFELQRRLNTNPSLSNISVIGVDPGAMPTGLLRRGDFTLSVLITKVALPLLAGASSKLSPGGMFRTPAKSASDILRAAFDVKTLGEHPKGVYLNGAEVWEASAEARDERKQRELWRDGARYCGLARGETVLDVWEGDF